MAAESAFATVERLRKPSVSFGPFTFDPKGQILRRGQEELALPPRVLGVLACLLRRAGDLVPRQEIIDEVWKEAFVTDTSLAEAISLLRQAIGDDPQSPTYIQTVHRRGYRFVAPVRTAGAEALVPELTAEDDQAGRVSPSIGGSLVPWSAAALCAALALAAVWQQTLSRNPQPPSVGRFTLRLPEGVRLDRRGPALAISPRGDRLAWAACDGDECWLFLRPLDRLEASALPGTEGAASPFFSPDGRWLGFFAGGKLKKVGLGGGSPIPLADVSEPRGGVWTPDGRIVFAGARASGLMQIPDDGGQAQPLTVPDQVRGEVRHAWPALSPDGGTLLFSIATMLEDGAPARLGAAALGRPRGSIRWTSALSGIGIVREAASDLIVFSRGGELQAVPFDPASLAPAGGPQTVVPAVAVSGGAAQFGLSRSGSLVYAAPDATQKGPAGLAWTAGAGMITIGSEPADTDDAALSPDGRRLAWSRSESPFRADIWVEDLQRGAATRLTHDGLNASPTWSPDGRTVFFARRTDRVYGIAVIDGEGGQSSQLPAFEHHAFPSSVSSDGSLVAVVQFDPAMRGDIWAVPIRGGAPRPLVRTPFDDVEPAYSPDGTLLAYQSDEAGRWDVCVLRLRDSRRGVVSTAGGERPFWAHDGRTLYYRSGSRLMSATVSDEDLRIGPPVIVMDAGAGDVLGVAPDGRFLVRRSPSASPSSVILVTDWLRELRVLLGPREAAMPR